MLLHRPSCKPPWRLTRYKELTTGTTLHEKLAGRQYKNGGTFFGTALDAGHLLNNAFYMEIKFYLEVNMKTAGGFERYGCFELGKDREFAVRLFKEMAGSTAADEKGMLHLDLVEKRNGLPMSMDVLSCTVEELSSNLKFLTRELFKRLNLDGSLP